MATKPSMIARPVVAIEDRVGEQDSRDRRRERELLHEEQRDRHQGDGEGQEPARAATHPFRRRQDEALDDAGEREHDGCALDPPAAHELRDPSTWQR